MLQEENERKNVKIVKPRDSAEKPAEKVSHGHIAFEDHVLQNGQSIEDEQIFSQDEIYLQRHKLPTHITLDVSRKVLSLVLIALAVFSVLMVAGYALTLATMPNIDVPMNVGLLVISIIVTVIFFILFMFVIRKKPAEFAHRRKWWRILFAFGLLVLSFLFMQWFVFEMTTALNSGKSIDGLGVFLPAIMYFISYVLFMLVVRDVSMLLVLLRAKNMKRAKILMNIILVVIMVVSSVALFWVGYQTYLSELAVPIQ